MKKLLTLSLAAFVFYSSAGYAQDARADRVMAAPLMVSPSLIVAGIAGAVAGSSCMTENASLNVSFNTVEKDIVAIKAKFDAQIVEIEKAIKDAGITNFELQSKNYGIYPDNANSINSGFRLNGNANFKITPADKAAELMTALMKKGYQANVNVNSYRNGGGYCPQNGTKSR